MSNSSIGAGGAGALAASLKDVPRLLSLNLGETGIGVGVRCNKIGDDGARALAACLKDVAQLRFLGLDGNDIGEDGVSAFSDVPSSPSLYVGFV